MASSSPPHPPSGGKPAAKVAPQTKPSGSPISDAQKPTVPATKSGGHSAVHRSAAQPAVPLTNSGSKLQAQRSESMDSGLRKATQQSAPDQVNSRKQMVTQEQEARRKQMGLDQVKLSGSIAGLDETGRRAEKLARREEEKRKAGGKNLVDKAILVDNTGRRWGNLVKLGILGTVVLCTLVYYGMHWLANRTVEDPKVAQRETRERLSRYAKVHAPLALPYEEDETVTAENFKARLETRIKNLLEDTRKSVTILENAGQSVPSASKDDMQRLEQDLAFVDGHGKPIVFNVTNEATVEIKSSASGGMSANATIPRRKTEPKKK